MDVNAFHRLEAEVKSQMRLIFDCTRDALAAIQRLAKATEKRQPSTSDSTRLIELPEEMIAERESVRKVSTLHFLAIREQLFSVMFVNFQKSMNESFNTYLEATERLKTISPKNEDLSVAQRRAYCEDTLINFHRHRAVLLCQHFGKLHPVVILLPFRRRTRGSPEGGSVHVVNTDESPHSLADSVKSYEKIAARFLEMGAIVTAVTSTAMPCIRLRDLDYNRLCQKAEANEPSTAHSPLSASSWHPSCNILVDSVWAEECLRENTLLELDTQRYHIQRCESQITSSPKRDNPTASSPPKEEEKNVPEESLDTDHREWELEEAVLRLEQQIENLSTPCEAPQHEMSDSHDSTRIPQNKRPRLRSFPVSKSHSTRPLPPKPLTTLNLDLLPRSLPEPPSFEEDVSSRIVLTAIGESQVVHFNHYENTHPNPKKQEQQHNVDELDRTPISHPRQLDKQEKQYDVDDSERTSIVNKNDNKKEKQHADDNVVGTSMGNDNHKKEKQLIDDHVAGTSIMNNRKKQQHADDSVVDTSSMNHNDKNQQQHADDSVVATSIKNKPQEQPQPHANDVVVSKSTMNNNSSNNSKQHLPPPPAFQFTSSSPRGSLLDIIAALHAEFDVSPQYSGTASHLVVPDDERGEVNKKNRNHRNHECKNTNEGTGHDRRGLKARAGPYTSPRVDKLLAFALAGKPVVTEGFLWAAKRAGGVGRPRDFSVVRKRKFSRGGTNPRGSTVSRGPGGGAGGGGWGEQDRVSQNPV